MIRFKYSIHNVLSARFFGGPILCGYKMDVSTTQLCISFNALKSLSRLWPIKMVFELNMDNRIAWTSRNVRVTLANVFSDIPE